MDNEIVRPSFSKIYEILDHYNIKDLQSWNKRHKYLSEWDQFYLDNDLFRFFEEATAYLQNSGRTTNLSEVRLLSSSLKREHLNLLAVLSNDGVIVENTQLEKHHDAFSHDLNYNSAYIPDILMEGLFSAKPLLVSDRAILVPGKMTLIHYLPRGGADLITLFSLDSAFTAPQSCFLRSADPTTVNLNVPETKDLSFGGDTQWEPILIPVSGLAIPILKGCPTSTLVKILSEEIDATWRLRFAIRKLLRTAEKTPTEVQLQAAFEEVEYQIRHLELEYKELLNKRIKSLSGVILGSVGLVLCLTLPGELAKYVRDIFGILSVAKSLEYIFSIRDTDNQLRKSDFYVAWKIWKKPK